MAVYNVHGGHNKIVPGAKGYLDELTEDRKITEGVLSLLKKQGHTVYNCTDEQGRTAGANLSNIVAKCNAHSAAMDISIHLNAAKKDTGDGRTKGVEVFVYNKNSKAYAAAERVCRKIATLGFTKQGSENQYRHRYQSRQQHRRPNRHQRYLHRLRIRQPDLVRWLEENIKWEVSTL